MKLSTMQELWDSWSENWYRKATVEINGIDTSVATLCEIKKGYANIVFHRYNKIKKIFKQSYFYKRHDYISRYKRAAILAYAISAADPLFYRESPENGLDKYYLKQRLAFSVAIGSIIQDFPQSAVETICRDGNIYDFESLGYVDRLFDQINNEQDTRDDFRMSVYKDLFFAEIYQNYNILTMANVFGLLTEKASILPAALEYHIEASSQDNSEPELPQRQEQNMECNGISKTTDTEAQENDIKES